MHSWGEPVLKCLIFLHRTKESHLWYLTVKNNTASFCCCFNVSAISMGTSVWRGRDREMWKRSKEVKCGGVPPSASLLDSYLELTDSQSSAALPHVSSCTAMAHRCCSWMWLFARQTRQRRSYRISFLTAVFQKLRQCETQSQADAVAARHMGNEAAFIQELINGFGFLISGPTFGGGKILIHRMVFIFNLSVDVQIFNFQFCAFTLQSKYKPVKWSSCI